MQQQIPKVKTYAKFKIVFIGDQAVGKTSIIQRFVYEQIPAHHQPTIGIDFLSKCISVDGKTVRLQLWDTAGQERFRSLIPSYIRDSHAAILVYDVACQQSFENIKQWLEYVREERGSDVTGILIANKIDMVDERVISFEEGEKYAKEQGLSYYEVSAKTGANIHESFKSMTQNLLGPDAPDPLESVHTQQQSSGGLQLNSTEQVGEDKQQLCGC